jgi:hypothetical protein
MAPVQPVQAEYVQPVLAEKLFRSVPPLQFPTFPFDADVTGIVEITERYDLIRFGKDRRDGKNEKEKNNTG